jgi:hypothetical protein
VLYNPECPLSSESLNKDWFRHTLSWSVDLDVDESSRSASNGVKGLSKKHEPLPEGKGSCHLAQRNYGLAREL